MSGWSRAGAGLGAMFGGGNDDAFRQRAVENLTINQKMALADQERMKTMALEAVINDDSLSQLERSLLGAELGTQFSGLQQGNLRQQEVGFRDDARTAALGGDMNAANAGLMALANGPVELTQIEGGGRFALNPFREGAEITPTEYGSADIGRLMASEQANLARAGASGAQAGASNASAQASLARAGLIEAQTADPARFRAPPQPRAAAPIAPAAGRPIRATNPATGEVLELQNGQWVKIQ